MGHGRKDEVGCGVVSIVNTYVYHKKEEEEDLRLSYQSLFPIKGVLITIIFRG